MPRKLTLRQQLDLAKSQVFEKPDPEEEINVLSKEELNELKIEEHKKAQGIVEKLMEQKKQEEDIEKAKREKKQQKKQEIESLKQDIQSLKSQLEQMQKSKPIPIPIANLQSKYNVKW